jgi:CBS domain-containing protein
VRSLPEIELYPASVQRTATFLEAAEVLVSYPVTTIAVLDHDSRVVGLFSDAGMLRGVFPPYLAELRHTAFASDEGILGERTRAVADEVVEQHMHKPESLDESTSLTHAAERFIHCDYGALPVVREDDGRFVGMLGRAEFCRAVLAKWPKGANAPRTQ